MEKDLKIKMIDLFTTTDCNLRCKYCFHDKNESYLDTKDIPRYFDNIFNISEDNMLINFFGGEPLLNSNAIIDTINYCKLNDKKYKFSLSTNGTIYDEKLFKFFIDNKVQIQVSIDGDEKTHNLYRGQHGVVVNNCKKMIDMGIGLGARLTFCPENVGDLYHNIDYIRSIGFKKIMHQGVQEAYWDDDSVEEFKKQTNKLFDLSNNYPDFKIKFIDRAKNFGNICDSGLLCQAGKSLIAMLPNGDIYPCHRFASSLKYKLGNVMSYFRRGIFLDITKDSIRGCGSCKSKKICHTCIAANATVNSSMFEPVSSFCNLIKYETKRGIEMGDYDTNKRLDKLEDMLVKLSKVVIDISDTLHKKINAEEDKKN